LILLDISHNKLTELQSGFFTALPKLIRLNLGYNNLSALDITVMPQLAIVSNSVDLNGNLLACDCLMFNTSYSWCRDNSVDLELVCSSPPEFKGTPRTIYDEVGCFDDDYIEEKVEGIVTE
jgi:Leucine-rich repeat (LRR) protein